MVANATRILLCALLLTSCAGASGDTTSDAAADAASSTAGDDAQRTGDKDGLTNEVDAGPVPTNYAHPLEHLDLTLDLSTGSGVAAWRVAATPTGGSVSFDIQGLGITDVEGGAGHTVRDGGLHVRLPVSAASPTVRVHYTFGTFDTMTGLMKVGTTVTWPDFCGNLFPCHTDPSEGVTWSLEVTGLPAGEVAVHPTKMSAPAPLYALAFAHGAYTYHKLGTTPGGVEIGVWLKPEQVDSTPGKLTALPKAVAWLEKILGPYPFGAKMAAVSVPWGLFAYGGLEMHPIYHVSDGAIGDLAVHCHEAAHGWFGNGVRLACWEDLVLSEGVADYLMVRARAAALGEQVMAPMFEAMSKSVASKAGTTKDIVVWPAGCGDVDVDSSGLNGKITYHKGALFLRAVAQKVGFDKLDAALGAFVKTHRGKAAGVADLLATIEAETGFDPKPLAKTWLQTPGNPAE